MASRDSRVERTVVCSTCGDFTGLQEEVIQHALNEHFRRSSIPWICPEGDFVTHVRGKMWLHWKNVHGSDHSENLRETCSGSFTDMSPDAFIKTDNPIVNQRKKDLSESISWGERKGRMSWHCEPPASRSWHEEPSSGRVKESYGDRRHVEVAHTSRAHHSDSDTKETSRQHSDEDIYERRQQGAEREENKCEL